MLICSCWRQVSIAIAAAAAATTAAAAAAAAAGGGAMTLAVVKVA
jgi:hypothetical protein